MLNLLGKRILTALIGISLAILVINYGQWAFAVTIILLALMGWYEYSAMLKNRNIKVCFWLGLFFIFLLLNCAWLGNTTEIIATLTIAAFLMLSLTLIYREKFNLTDAAFSIMGLIYIGISFSHLILLRFTDNSLIVNTVLGSLSQGAVYLWIPFLGTWASDTFAYFVGSIIGKHKLCPTISPGKTVEGAVGGFLGCIIVVGCFGTLFLLPLVHSIAIGIIVGLTAPSGDLVESMLKRFAGVKDSGKLLPGHGGVLDRFDSILFAIPIVYYYIQFCVIS